jgi:hypothetical protein
MSRRTGVWLLVGAVLFAGCVVPTDRSADVAVELEAIGDLFASDTVFARARIVEADGSELPPTAIVFASTDPSVLSVNPDGRVVAAGPGTADVTARSRTLASAEAASVSVRVFAAVQVDSVRPASVRYGDVLRLFGVGLEPGGGGAAVRIDGQEAPIAGFTLADPDRPDGFGVLEVIVVPPVGLGAGVGGVATLEATVTVANGRGGANVTAPLTVEMRDRFEPNDTVAADLGVLSAAVEMKGLALDHLTAGERHVPVDWYTFTTTTPGDWTITLAGTEVWAGQPEMQLITGTDMLSFTEEERAVFWYVDDPGTQMAGSDAACRGFVGALAPGLDFVGSWAASAWGNAPAVRLPVENLPAGTHHLIIGFGGERALEAYPWGPGWSGGAFQSVVQAGFRTPDVDREALRYDLRIEPGTVSPVAPDAYEGNDFCADAPTLLALGTTAIADSAFDLSIDAEFDWDWFRVDGQTAGRLFLTVTSETMTRPPRVFVYHPSPGMDGPIDRMTTEAQTTFGVLRSDRDGLQGMPVDTLAYYVVVSPNAGATVGPGQQGEPGPYRLTFAWDPGAITAPPRDVFDSTGSVARWWGEARRAPGFE